MERTEKEKYLGSYSQWISRKWENCSSIKRSLKSCL